MPETTAEQPSGRRRRRLVPGAAAALLVVLVVVGALLLVRGGGDGDEDAASSCADVEFLGAAGSGQREPVPATDGGAATETAGSGGTPAVDPADAPEIADSGVGGIVEDTFRNLGDDLRGEKTVSLRAVDYPALAVPRSLDSAAWQDFLDSVSAGADAAQALIEGTMAECPDSEIVVAGYSQGAMAVRRAVERTGPVERIAAVVLIGDGDKMPDDNVVEVTDVPGYGTGDRQGIAQAAAEIGIASGAVHEVLPAQWGDRVISACHDGDLVCAPASFSPTNLGAHGSYDADDWRQLLADLVVHPQ